MNAVLNRAIRFLGSQAALARSLGIRPQAVQQWTVTGCVPPKRCRAVEDATGGKVTRYALRPDVFGARPQHRTDDDPGPQEILF
ncbi:MAG: transcriptional regulator [Gammaproteobacteria bacterium]